MRGIECAFMATIGQEVELKTSKSGKPFCSFGAVVTMGQDEGGKDISQWLRIGCFGDVAEQLAARAKKGDKIYVEGALTMTQWNDAHGEVKHGLNVAAWKCERLSNIGRNRARFTYAPDEPDEAPSPSLPIAHPAHKRRTGKMAAIAFGKVAKTALKPSEPEFDDPLPF